MEFPFSSTIAIAHRGAHGTGYPENSLTAVERAVELGAPAVEFDVCNLRDGKLVISHDGWTKVHGEWAPLQLLSATDLERGPLCRGVPGVEPFLEVVADSNLLLNLDWKGAGEESRIGDVLTSYGLVGRTIVSSTDPRALVRLKEAHPNVVAGLSFSAGYTGPPPDSRRDPGSPEIDHRLHYVRRWLPQNVPALIHGSRANALMLDYRVISEEAVTAVRSQDAGLFLWTANDTATFEALVRFVPDGIATDVISQELRCSARQPKRQSFSRSKP